MTKMNLLYAATILCCVLFAPCANGQTNLLDGNGEAKVMLKNCTAINSSALDFSPTFYQSGLVYVSSRRKNGRRDLKIGETFFDLYFSALDGNGLPTEPDGFSLELNSQDYEGPVSFSRAGDLLYLTRSNQQNGAAKADSKRKIRLKIYEAQRGARDWENIRELPFDSDDYTCQHPTISADGKKLYFASDMPGGFGGMDLYVSERKGDTWTLPRNLGNTINTTQSEAFPFIHESGNLFFSSNGRGGFGDFDIFKVNLNDGTLPVNMGEPVNSAKDDIGLILKADGTRGYLSSNRGGGIGKDDIYEFEATTATGIAPPPALTTTLLKVRDAQTRKNIEGATVHFFQTNKEGFLGNNDLYDVLLLPVTEEAKELNIKLVRKDDAKIRKPDQYSDIRGEARHETEKNRKYLVLVNKEGYETAEIAYTADSQQAIEVDLNRKNCVTLRALARNQATIAPLANVLMKVTNNCTQETQMLRTDDNGELKTCLKTGCDYSLEAEKEGYRNTSLRINSVSEKDINQPRNIIVDMSQSSAAVVSSPVYKNTTNVTTGSVLVLENIYYDFNQYIIRPDAATELDALAAFLRQQPSIEIELRSHTDARGSASANQQLSEKRARQAKQYLANQGIRAERVKAVGMGESELRNGCKDGVECSETEHQYNRRTEVKILKMDDSVRIEYGNAAPKVVGGKQ